MAKKPCCARTRPWPPQVEQARDDQRGDTAATAEHERTLAALRRLSVRPEKEVTLPHFRTVQRHGTQRVQLVVPDEESAEVIRTALRHISRNSRRSGAEPVETIGGLQRRLTLREAEGKATVTTNDSASKW